MPVILATWEAEIKRIFQPISGCSGVRLSPQARRSALADQKDQLGEKSF
jgi:hypothetical protein